MKKLVVLLILCAVIFVGCDLDCLNDISKYNGYTVVNKYRDHGGYYFFLVKTEHYRIWKETVRGLSEQGVKGEVVWVSKDIFNSYFEGEVIIKPARR